MFKRLPRIYMALLLISPFLVSFIFHMVGLYFSDAVGWGARRFMEREKPLPVKIAQLPGRREDRLRFQGKDQLDSFRSDDSMVYPSPEIEYRAVAPEVEFYPDAKVSEELDIISIEAEAMDHEWVNPSTGRQPFHTGPERFVGSFSRQIQVLREGGLDVAFVFDSTASMTSFLLEVKSKIEHLAGALKKLVPTCRISLVAYRDTDEESGFVTRVHPLSYGTQSIYKFLADINAWGGGDREEAVFEALRVAVNDLNWNDRSKKFILIIGDAPPHGKDMDSAVALVDTFRRDMGGTLAVIDTRGADYEIREKEIGNGPTYLRHFSSEDTSYQADRHSVMEEFRKLAYAGRGEAARLENEEKVVKNMLLLIFGERWELYLGEFMKNL